MLAARPRYGSSPATAKASHDHGVDRRLRQARDVRASSAAGGTGRAPTAAAARGRARTCTGSPRCGWPAARPARWCTKNTAMRSCAHCPTNFPFRSRTRVPRSSLLQVLRLLHPAAADDAPGRERVEDADDQHRGVRRPRDAALRVVRLLAVQRRRLEPDERREREHQRRARARRRTPSTARRPSPGSAAAPLCAQHARGRARAGSRSRRSSGRRAPWRSTSTER